jgi:hypothetical protein
VHWAEAGMNGLVQVAHARPIADVGWDRKHVCGPARSNGRKSLGSLAQPFVIAIRDTDF